MREANAKRGISIPAATTAVQLIVLMGDLTWSLVGIAGGLKAPASSFIVI